jgi:hypothetical protein
MKNVANKTFGLATAGALALTPMAAHAEDAAVPANGNAASVQQVAFSTFDGRQRSIRFVEAGAAEASRDKVAIIVWSGNRELQQEAYNAALQLRDEGYSLALILGPSLGEGDNDANIQVYARGVPVYEGTGAWIGRNNADMVRPETVRMAREASISHFPREVASLAPAQD